MARGDGGLGQGATYYRFDAKKSGLERKARNALGQWTSLQAVTERVNKASVAQMSEWAVDHLDERIQREPGPEGRTGRLEAAVRDPKSHFVNRDGFEFMVASRMYQHVAYWRAIEHGSRHMVGRRLRLIFLRGGQVIGPDQARSGTGSGSRARGGLDSARLGTAKLQKDGTRASSTVPYVTIRRPIQAYGYGRAAIERFQANDFAWYRQAMEQEMQRSGFAVTAAGRRR